MIYKLALSMINGIGNISAKKLLAYLGSPQAIFEEKKQNLIKIPGIGIKAATEICNKEALKKAENELKFIQKYKIRTLFYTDAEYPNRLKNYDDAPVIIYFKGDTNFNQEKIISIVGTRNATHQGLEYCKKMVEDATERSHKILIISGLAYGIDIQAHKSALQNNQETVAVLGHSLKTIYPAAHKSIAKDILNKGGGLLSEFPSYSKMEPSNFVRRNRIIAGMADAIIVVESANKGGSLITAKIANDYNKDVFAFPGRVNDKYSQGCNHLIKTHQASLIESFRDIEYIMGWEMKKQKVVQKQLFLDFSEEEELIMKILKENGNTSIDILSIQANMPMSKTSSLLLGLEFKGVVISYPGKIYGASF